MAKAKPRWSFEDAMATAVFTHASIMEFNQPVLHVYHDSDGAWQFLDGVSTNENRNARIMSLGEIVRNDPTLLAIADLPVGWSATRTKPGARWKRKRCDE